MVDIRRFLLSAIGLPLTVIRYCTGHSRKQEGGGPPSAEGRQSCAYARAEGCVRFAQGANGENCIPEIKRVQAPAAPGFYRSCADALTDGFCPQSGLVQRECFMLPVGSAPFGALRHNLCPAKAVGLWALGSDVNLSLWQQRRENHTTGLRPEENKPTALRALEMHPFCRLSAASPPEGEICSPLSFWIHKYLKA